MFIRGNVTGSFNGLIVISYYYKNNTKRYILRDIYYVLNVRRCNRQNILNIMLNYVTKP